MAILTRILAGSLLIVACPVTMHSQAIHAFDPSTKENYSDSDRLALQAQFHQVEVYFDQGEYEKAKQISERALMRAVSLPYPHGIAEANYALGICYTELKRYPEAKYCFEESMIIAETKQYPDLIAGNMTYLGWLKSRENEPEDALEMCRKSLTLFTKSNHIRGQALANYHLSLIHFNLNQLDTAIRYVDRALDLATSIPYPRGMALYSGFAGGLLGTKGEIDKAYGYLVQALELWKTLGNKNAIAYEEHRIGGVNFYKGNYTEALSHFLEALRLRKETGNEAGMGDSYHDIGNIYLEQGAYTEALKNYQEALAIFTRNDIKKRMAMAYTSIGNAYSNLNMVREAIEHFQNGLQIKLETDDLFGLPYSYNNLASMYIRQGDYPEARKFSEAAKKISLQVNDWGALALCYLQLGRIQIHDNELTAGNISLDSALYWADQSNYAQVRLGAYESLAHLDSLNGDFESAYVHYKLFKHYQDSVTAADKEQIISDLKIRYESEKKDLEITRLASREEIHKLQLKVQEEYLAKSRSEKDRIYAENLYQKQRIEFLDQEHALQLLSADKQYADSSMRENKIKLLEQKNDLQAIGLMKQKQWRNYMVIGFLLLCILSYFIYSYVITRQKLKLQTLRNKIASDLHDDVGSTLSSIAIFSEIAQQQSREVIPLLDTITTNSRQMLDAMADIVWTINPENDQFENIILRMKSYAYELLGARQIGFDFTSDPGISSIKLPMEVRKNLYLIFKEATNNLAKYSNAEKALFTLHQHNDRLIMTIRDFGKGFDTAMPMQGNGLKNMKKRAREVGGDLQIESKPHHGTTIHFTFDY
jgi:signal transduction histidine kinase